MSTYSLPTKFGFVASDMLNRIGLHPSTGLVIGASRSLGLLAAAGLSFVLLVRSPRIGLVRAFAFSSLAIVMLGPVVWPWYLATGFALLAASGVGRWRPSYIVLLVSATALVWPAGISPLASILALPERHQPAGHRLRAGCLLGGPAPGRSLSPAGRPDRRGRR